MKLYDTQRSGNAWKVRLLAGFLGRSLARRTLSIDRGDLCACAFRDIAPLGQVPVLEIEGVHVAESMAILFLLAQRTTWWPAQEQAQARVLSWLSFEQHRHMRPLSTLRLHLGLGKFPMLLTTEIEELSREAHAALALMERQLATGPQARWMATNSLPSIADVALYPYTCMAPMGGISLDAYPAVRAWLSRIEALEGYQPLFPEIPRSNFFTREQGQEHPDAHNRHL